MYKVEYTYQILELKNFQLTKETLRLNTMMQEKHIKFASKYIDVKEIKMFNEIYL